MGLSTSDYFLLTCPIHLIGQAGYLRYGLRGEKDLKTECSELFSRHY